MPYTDADDQQAVLFNAAPSNLPEAGKHWYVPDTSGHYCMACGLPRSNTRVHAKKAA